MSSSFQKSKAKRARRRAAAIQAQKTRQSKGNIHGNTEQEESKQKEIQQPEAASAAMEVDERTLLQTLEPAIKPENSVQAPKDYAEKANAKPEGSKPKESLLNWKGVAIGACITSFVIGCYYAGGAMGFW
jgi:hypothetical protein